MFDDDDFPPYPEQPTPAWMGITERELELARTWLRVARILVAYGMKPPTPIPAIYARHNVLLGLLPDDLAPPADALLTAR